jgi:hypothetical protein
MNDNNTNQNTNKEINTFDRLISRFQAYTETHPNISQLWLEYLELRKKKMEDMVVQGNLMLLQLEQGHVTDPAVSDIMLVIIYLKSLDNT